MDSSCSAAVEGGSLCDLVPRLPIKGRFWSSETAGVMVHKLLPKSVSRAFPDWDAGDVLEPLDNDDEDCDYRKKCSAKYTGVAKSFVTSRAMSLAR